MSRGPYFKRVRIPEADLSAMFRPIDGEPVDYVRLMIMRDPDPKPVLPHVSEDFQEWNGRCPDCGNTSWVGGPRAGAFNQNINCTACNCRLNIAAGPGLMLAQRLRGSS